MGDAGLAAVVPAGQVWYHGAEPNRLDDEGVSVPDIEMRFHRDMLVLSAPVDVVLARQGVDVEKDLEFLNLVEPDSVRDALLLQTIAGAQCLTASTAGITRARLMHHGLEDRSFELAAAALAVAQSCTPQHLLAEVGFCELPLDPSSKASLNEHRLQYAQAARDLEGSDGSGVFDAYLLTGFRAIDALKCALMGLRQASDRAVFASIAVNPDGTVASGEGTVEDAAAMMEEYGAQVAGIRTSADADTACKLAKRVIAACDLPVLVELDVAEVKPRQGRATEKNPYYCADVMVEAAAKLRRTGIQFLRAVGAATPAYTGALAVATGGFDVTDDRGLCQ